MFATPQKTSDDHRRGTSTNATSQERSRDVAAPSLALGEQAVEATKPSAAATDPRILRAEIEDRLTVSRRNRECAERIDDWRRSRAEVARYDTEIEALNAELAAMDGAMSPTERDHLENAVSALGDRHAG